MCMSLPREKPVKTPGPHQWVWAGTSGVTRGREHMSRQQYAFITGVLLVWMAWAAGWVVLAAVAAGLIGLGIVRVLEGQLDLGEVAEKFRSSSDRSRR
jgi:hypothetical protein